MVVKYAYGEEAGKGARSHAARIPVCPYRTHGETL